MPPAVHWQDILTPRDREVMQQAGYGARMGFGERPALLVIDVTWGFCGDRPEPILDSIQRWPNSCGEESWAAIAVLQPLLAAFRGKGLPVLYTTGNYRKDKWDMGSWLWKHARSQPATVPARHDDRDPDGIVSAVAPAESDIVIPKQKPSAFFGTPLQSYLTLLRADTLVVAGCTTSGCVRATVVDAFSANYRVAVVEDACFDRSQTSHAVSLMDMHAKYSDVVHSADVLAYVAQHGGGC
jgi:maleamate amidohydrolase